MFKEVVIYWGDPDVGQPYILYYVYGHGNIIIQ